MLVSIIMPVFNGIEFLQESIDSILNQTHEDFEFIILDDGSTEPVYDLIENCLDTRIRLFRNDKNIGLTKSLNICLDKVRGDFIVRHDADDVSHSTRIEEQLKLFKSDSNLDSNIGFVGCWVEAIDIYGSHIKGFVDSCHCSDDDLKTKYPKILCMPDASTIYSKEAIRKVGYFDARLYLGQTYNYSLRVLNYFSGGIVPKILYSARQHENQTGRRTRQKLKSENKSISWSALAQQRANEFPIIKERQ